MGGVGGRGGTGGGERGAFPLTLAGSPWRAVQWIPHLDTGETGLACLVDPTWVQVSWVSARLQVWLGVGQ